jgi:hypothetical protein
MGVARLLGGTFVGLTFRNRKGMVSFRDDLLGLLRRLSDKFSWAIGKKTNPPDETGIASGENQYFITNYLSEYNRLPQRQQL